jgi:hypothetical protein
MATHEMEQEHRDTWLGFCKLMAGAAGGAALVLALLALFVA